MAPCMHERCTAPIPITTEAIPIAIATVAVAMTDTAADSTGKEVHVCCMIHMYTYTCWLLPSNRIIGELLAIATIEYSVGNY